MCLETEHEGWKHTLPPHLDWVYPIQLSKYITTEIQPLYGALIFGLTTPFWSTLLLLGLMALGLARHPNSQRSFSLWIATLVGIAHVGWGFGAVLLPLVVLQQLHPRSRWTILLELGILPILFISLIRLMVLPTSSAWLWEDSHLQWYADYVTDIPTIEVTAIPLTWTLVPWGIWMLWMLFEILPSLLRDLTELLKVALKKNPVNTTKDTQASE